MLEPDDTCVGRHGAATAAQHAELTGKQASKKILYIYFACGKKYSSPLPSAITALAVMPLYPGAPLALSEVATAVSEIVDSVGGFMPVLDNRRVSGAGRFADAAEFSSSVAVAVGLMASSPSSST